ncbi:MAG: hypothetical protein WKF97_01255 [Chitinophagaceae bacterium]
MLLYAIQETPRLQYITAFISKEIFREAIRITTSKDHYIVHKGPKINYSPAEISDAEFWIMSTELLFQKDIKEQSVQCFNHKDYKAFFKTTTGSNFAFDILAAIFYLLSRYEEYLPHQKDDYGRFAHTNSLAFKENFLHLPIINIWLEDLKKELHYHYPELGFRFRRFTFLPTYDIDMAYSYLHKGWWRNLGGSVRSVLDGDWRLLKERLTVLQGKMMDPFDSYEWLDGLHLYCRVKAYYFFLVASKRMKHDKNIDPESEAMETLIKYHASGYQVGIHPSWQSGDHEILLKQEIEWLGYLVNKKVDSSRQHYIRLSLPETYLRLIRLGIRKEFSMGYGSINGFRASVASSFYWYDLANENSSDLLIYPFCFMDANAYYEEKLTAKQALEELMWYYHQIKKVNGLMVTIWHNNFLGNDQHLAGWKKVYETFLKEEVFWDRT